MKDPKDFKDCVSQIKSMMGEGKSFVIELTAYSPYDGCFWEPNFFRWIPEVSEWRPIYASGKIIKGLESIYQYRDKDQQKQYAEYIGQVLAGGDYPYELERVLVWDDQLYKHIDEHFWANFVESDDAFVWKCSECHGELAFGHVNYSGYRGNGGVGIINSGAVCDDCWIEGICLCCNEYYGISELFDGGLCEYCREKLIKKNLSDEEKEELEELIETIDERAPEELRKICEVNPKFADKYKEDQKRVLEPLIQRRNEIINIALKEYI